MLSEARQKKIMEKLNRAQKCSILGPQNLGSRGGPGPRGPPGSAPGVPASDYILSAAITLKNVCETLSHDPTPTWWCFYFEDCSGILFPCPGGTGYAGK